MAKQSGKNTSEAGAPKKELLGEALIKSGLISKEQLQKALKRRAQVDLPLGSILIEMGFLSTGPPRRTLQEIRYSRR